MSTISVIIPVYDREARMLREAVDSALAQTSPPTEIIVVDDGSPEPVSPDLADYGDAVRCLRQDNGGIGAARNAGIAASSGHYLAFVDSDDVWLPDKLERQLQVFADDPSLDAVYGRAEQFYDEQTSEEYRARHPIKQPVLDAWLSCAKLITREAFDSIGPFATTSAGVDVEWQLRARDAGLRTVMLPTIVYRRRLHENNIGITARDLGHRERLLALKQSLDRRRDQAQSAD